MANRRVRRKESSSASPWATSLNPRTSSKGRNGKPYVDWLEEGIVNAWKTNHGVEIKVLESVTEEESEPSDPEQLVPYDTMATSVAPCWRSYT